MLTGVSKFSKVSLFSGLNNLKDITEPLLFQAGYLTILKEESYPGGIFYTLGFPNP
jgi:hypothetical protein